MNVPRAEVPTALAIALLLLAVSGCATRAPSGPEPAPASEPAPLPFRASEGRIRGRVERATAEGGAAGSEPVVMLLEPSDAAATAPDPSLVREVRIGEVRQAPQLVVVPTDTRFRFRNLDPIHHTLFSLETPDAFEVRLAGGRSSDELRLPKAGLVRAYCRLHPTEAFALLVSPAIHVVEARADGRFAIPAVTAGDYRIRASSLDAESASVPIQVIGGRPLAVALTLSPRGRR